MLRGLTTTTFFADDVAATKKWYTELFGLEPYFVRPVDGPPLYVEWRLGDYLHEFGLVHSDYAPHEVSGAPAGAIAYWHVDDIEAAVEHLLAVGAKENEPATVRGDGYITASVVDPFGNVLGVMYNEHYLDILAGR